MTGSTFRLGLDLDERLVDASLLLLVSLSALFEEHDQRTKQNQAEVSGGATQTAGGEKTNADLHAGSQTQNQERVCVTLKHRTVDRQHPPTTTEQALCSCICLRSDISLSHKFNCLFLCYVLYKIVFFYHDTNRFDNKLSTEHCGVFFSMLF